MVSRTLTLLALFAIAPPIAAKQVPKPPAAPRSVDSTRVNVEEIWSRILGPASGRHAARMALAPIGAAAIPVVQSHYSSPSWQERWEVVNALGVIHDPSAADFLVNAVTTDDNLHVRWRGLWALAAVSNPDSPAKLRKLLDHKDRKTRWNAAVSLGFFKQPDAVPVLKENLNTSDDWERWEAVNGLGQVFDDETSSLIVPLIPSLAFGAQREAVMTLSRIGDETALTALVDLLAHPDPELRWRAAMGLATNDHRTALPVLEARLLAEANDNVRKEIRKAIAKLAGSGKVSKPSAERVIPAEPATAETQTGLIERRVDLADCRPVFRGTNVLVEDVLRGLAAAKPHATLLKSYPTLNSEHLLAALTYAADVLADKGLECPTGKR